MLSTGLHFASESTASRVRRIIAKPKASALPLYATFVIFITGGLRVDRVELLAYEIFVLAVSNPRDTDRG